MDSRPTDSTCVYTLGDLERWNCAADEVSLAVLGHPVAHSASPAMHNAALSALSKQYPRFAKWRYYKFDIAAPMLGNALARFAEKGFLGLNLTLPLKVDVLSILKERSIFPAAAAARAANTLVRHSGDWQGDNTDVTGLRYGIEQSLGANLQAQSCVILGTGGAARAAVAMAAQAGAPAIQVRSRTLARAQAFCKEMGGVAHIEYADALRPLPENALVINATPLGLKLEDASPLSASLLRPGMKVFDMTYAAAPSRLLQIARQIGLACCDGLPMLAAQGFYALAQWVRSADVAIQFPESVYLPLMLEAARSAIFAPSSHDTGR